MDKETNKAEENEESREIARINLTAEESESDSEEETVLKPVFVPKSKRSTIIEREEKERVLEEKARRKLEERKRESKAMVAEMIREERALEEAEKQKRQEKKKETKAIMAQKIKKDREIQKTMFDSDKVARPKGELKNLSLNGNEVSHDKSPLVVCFGEMLVDFVPTVSGVSLAEAPSFKKAPGGAPANVAVCIAKLGGSSAFIGKVGDDEFGRMLSEILKENKVNNSGVRFDHFARTALAFVTLRSDGKREFVFFGNPSADMLLRESELDVDLVKKASIFHFGSISLIKEPCRSTHLAAMDIAKKSGSLLSYDPNLRLPLWPSEDAARKEIMDIWDRADVIKISEDEISFLTNGDDPNDDDVVLKKLLHPNLRLLLVSEGKAGCRYYTKEFKGRVNGVKVKAVDTTGAGDGFTGGILYCLASDVNLIKDEKRLREALLFANACGALTVTQNGAIPALPTKEAVQQIMSQNSS